MQGIESIRVSRSHALHRANVGLTSGSIQIRLAALWVALMLTYLLGDVLRIFASDFKPGEIGGVKATPALWLVAAVIMLVPIAMLLVSVTSAASHRAGRISSPPGACSPSISPACGDTQASTTVPDRRRTGDQRPHRVDGLELGGGLRHRPGIGRRPLAGRTVTTTLPREWPLSITRSAAAVSASA